MRRWNHLSPYPLPRKRRRGSESGASVCCAATRQVGVAREEEEEDDEDGIKENDGVTKRDNPGQSGLALMNKELGGETFRETG